MWKKQERAKGCEKGEKKKSENFTGKIAQEGGTWPTLITEARGYDTRVRGGGRAWESREIKGRLPARSLGDCLRHL